MGEKNLIQALGEIGMASREAEEEIRKSGVEQSDISNYQTEKPRQVYDILCPLNQK
jgi:hypothetical protein